MNASASPMVSSTSRVRAWTPSARLWVAGPAALSMTQVWTPRASSWAARVSPVGPAPTTRTWQSADDVFVVMRQPSRGLARQY